MIEALQSFFITFISYAFIGWLFEVIIIFIEFRKLVNRGFLIGPYLPIYGFGAQFITILLQKYSNDIIVLFVFSMLICSILEYFTSYIMEKVFRARWWDYSDRKFNINGRICLRNMIAFGVLGVIIIKFINPLINNFYNSFNKNILNIIFLLILLVYISDFIISTIILISVRKENKKYNGDSTEKMSKEVYNRIKELGWAYRRLLNAFPNVYQIIDNSRQKALNYIKKKTKKYIKKEQQLIEKSKEKLEKIQDKYNEKINKIRKKADKVISKMEKKK